MGGQNLAFFFKWMDGASSYLKKKIIADIVNDLIASKTNKTKQNKQKQNQK